MEGNLTMYTTTHTPNQAQLRYLPNADSRAVTPINPAAQKFHRLSLCRALDNSVAVPDSSMPSLMLGKRHIADMNQNTAEPHAVTIIAVSMNDLIVTPGGSVIRRIILNCIRYRLYAHGDVDPIRGKTAAFVRGTDHVRTKHVREQCREFAEKATKRRTHGGSIDHRISWHGR